MKPIIIKKMLMISGIVMAAGLLLIGISFATGNVQGFYVNSKGLVMDSLRKDFKSGEIELGELKNIDLNVNDGDVEFRMSDHYYLEYNYPNDIEEPTYQEEDGTLTFTDHSRGFPGFQFGFSFAELESGKVIIGLPKDAYLENITVNNDNGDTTVTQVTAKELEIDTSFGDISADGITVDDANLNADDGNIKVENSKIITMVGRSDFSDITLDEVTFSSLDLKLSDGDVKTNDIDFNEAKINSDFGDVDLSLTQEEELYVFDLDTDFGEIIINGDHRDSEKYKQSNGEKHLKVNTSDGDITIHNK